MKCGKPTEIYSRVVGYFRPVQDWNEGKKQEFQDRKPFIAKPASNQTTSSEFQERNVCCNFREKNNG